jgi:hypothetical protein
VNKFLFELSAFPRGKHDGWVDAWSQAAGELTSGVSYEMFTSAVNVFAGLGPSYFRKAVGMMTWVISNRVGAERLGECGFGSG